MDVFRFISIINLKRQTSADENTCGLNFSFAYCIIRKYEITLILTVEVNQNPFHLPN